MLNRNKGIKIKKIVVSMIICDSLQKFKNVGAKIKFY